MTSLLLAQRPLNPSSIFEQLHPSHSNNANSFKYPDTGMCSPNSAHLMEMSTSSRAKHVAMSGRRLSQILQVSDLPELKRAVNFANTSRFVGNGLVAFDVVGRGKNIINAYARNDGTGHRTMFKESAGFALGAFTGVGIGIAATKLVLCLALGPLGWTLIIGAGIISAAVIGTHIDTYMKGEKGDNHG